MIPRRAINSMDLEENAMMKIDQGRSAR